MKKSKTIDPNTLTTQALHGLLLTAVAPRPIAFASTVNNEGAVNLSPFSFFNVFSANPPILVFSPARRGTDNTTKDSFENVKQVKEVSINVVNYAMVTQMSLASTPYDKGVNEFVKSGLTPIASDKIRPPRVGESPVSFECVVDQIIELGDQAGAGNLVICRVVAIHINEDYLDQNDTLDSLKLDLVARMGGNWYNRVTKDSIFEIEKPLHSKGIGVDKLPLHAQNSKLLTGNDLGRLGNCAQLPDPQTLIKTKMSPEVKAALDLVNMHDRERAIHSIAKSLLKAQRVEDALKALCCL